MGVVIYSGLSICVSVHNSFTQAFVCILQELKKVVEEGEVSASGLTKKVYTLCSHSEM